MNDIVITFSAFAVIFLITIVYYKIRIKRIKNQTAADIKNEIAALEIEKQAAQERLEHEEALVKQKLVFTKQQETNLLRAELERLKLENKREYEKSFLIRKQEQEEELRLMRENALKALDEERAHIIEHLKINHEEILSKMLEEQNELEQLLGPLKIELEEYRKKREAINQDILRNRALEMEKDFSRIIIDEIALEDIQFLLGIENHLNNKQTIRKLIWSEYIQRPMNEMIKRVLGGKSTKNCIYKITNLETQEIYIGKTRAEVSKRWIDHIKTSLGIGTVSQAGLHVSLKKYYWHLFSFEVLEQNVEENLNEREKYWIDFYQSNIYGLNIKS